MDGRWHTDIGDELDSLTDGSDEEEPQSFFVKALYSYTAPDDSSLSFQQGDVIEVLTQLESGWWDGLLGDRRGWFPSNFVQIVDEDEVFGHSDEPSLEDGYEGQHAGQGYDRSTTRGEYSESSTSQAQPGFETAISFSTATYPSDGNFSSSLGLGQDFAALRELMTAGESSNLGGSSDAFDQLAEAAMVGASGDRFQGRSVSQSALSSTEQTSDSHLYKTRMTRAASGPAGHQSPPEDLIRSRPRAATGLDSLASQKQMISSSGPKYSAPPLSPNTPSAKESDYWVPKVTNLGEIVYFNTRTGAQSSELPEGDHDESAYASSHAPSEDDEVDETDLAVSKVAVPFGADLMPLQSSELFSKIGRQKQPSISSSSHRRVHNDKPPTMVRNEVETLELQKLLANRPTTPLLSRVHHTSDTIATLADLCSEVVACDGLSDVDRETAVELPELLTRSGIRLLQASNEVVHAVRTLLYTCGLLKLSISDLSVIGDVHSASSQGGIDADAATSALARAISVMQLGQTSLSQQVPSSVRECGAKLSSSVSKLVLSVRAVTEQHTLPLGSEEDEKSALHAQRLNALRQRVQENAVDLLGIVESLAVELGRFNAFSEHSPPSWLQRFEPKLASATDGAGVGHESLAGGSAAGWRGNGFVIPTSLQQAVHQLQQDTSLFTQETMTENSRLLLANANESIARRPDQPLSESHVRDALQPQVDDLTARLTRLTEQVSGSFHDANQASTAASASTASNGAQSLLTSKQVGNLLELVSETNARAATFLVMLEDIDFASALDVDGPPPFTEVKAAQQSWQALSFSANDGMQSFTALKQGVYDAVSKLLLNAQTFSSFEGFGEEPSNEAVRQLVASAALLKETASDTLSIAIDLAQVAEEQQRLRLPFCGARAQTYGLEEAQVAVSSLLSKEQSSRGTTNQSAPQAGQRTTSLAPVATRDRSASVATGRSAPERSQLDQGQRGPTAGATRLARRYTEGEEGSGREGEPLKPSVPQQSTNKLRKFFGEDSSSTTAASTPSQTPAPGPPVKRPNVEEEVFYLQPDYAPEDIVLTPEGQVKGATLPALVERLTMHNSFDASFNNTFLMTYRSFTTTTNYLEMLFDRFRIQSPPELTPSELNHWAERKQKPIRLRVFNVLKSWLEQYFYEGEDDEHLATVKRFAVEMAEHAMELPSRQLLRLVERRQGEGEPMVRKMVLPTVAPPPVLPKSLRKIKFLDIDPVEMARQLTLLESKLYNNIKPTECLGKAWSKTGSDTHAKGIKDTINTSNRITGWVAEAILVQDDLKKRVAWIKHFIAIADSCRLLQNFSTMTAIVSGLNSAPVYRLKRSWDSINGRFIAVLENLNRIMQSSKNFSDYREMIHQLQPPCVPFLGVYLTDLTFIEDGNTDRLKSDQRLINFGKRQKTAEVIREIMIYQATPYSLTPVPGIQKFIQDNLVEARSDGELYAQSLNLEPREREDEKISRLLAESGFL